MVVVSVICFLQIEIAGARVEAAAVVIEVHVEVVMTEDPVEEVKIVGLVEGEEMTEDRVEELTVVIAVETEVVLGGEIMIVGPEWVVEVVPLETEMLVLVVVVIETEVVDQAGGVTRAKIVEVDFPIITISKIQTINK